MAALWAAWKTIIEEGPLRMPSPPSKLESAYWYDLMSQINVLSGAALNFNEFGEGKANRCDRIDFGPRYWRWLA
jgi:hypothetical protein